MRRATSEDALLVVSVEPCARQAVDATRFALRWQVSVVAITSSEISPVARNARHVITVNTSSPSFFDAITPTVAVVEVLLALLAGRRGEAAVAAIAASVEQFDEMQIYWAPPERRRQSNGSRTGRE
jgi:DNA-binding MurR/RpiR family transcriptional regulator